MRKKVFGRQLSRDRDSRIALFRALIKSLVEKGSITTTKAKAKAIQPDVDKIMNTVTENTVAARRRILARLGNDRETTDKLFRDYLPLGLKRKSGFTRIVPLPRRRGDNALMAVISWVDKIEVKEKKESKKEEVKKVVKKETKKENK